VQFAAPAVFHKSPANKGIAGNGNSRVPPDFGLVVDATPLRSGKERQADAPQAARLLGATSTLWATAPATI